MIFLEQTRYSIDDLLHSGLVIFGDDISNYVSAVAEKLLEGEDNLKNKLRFYTLKSNNTNAFSTDQGIIFVTTGLISQLTSEAQLAYILAHEISHYVEHHVVETFIWKKEQKFKDGLIGEMSIYSKDKEFRADSLAVGIYYKSGYSKEELISVFDVLLYSYLPFEEEEISLSYFESEKMHLPKSLFPEEAFGITVVEDYDDTDSSHPNIKKRKERTLKQMEIVGDAWGTKLFELGEVKFKEIRNIARFECVRTSILNAQYGNAIYYIYLLEIEFPNSIYLKRMKAQSWLGLYQYSKKGYIRETIKSRNDYEGSSANIHFFIGKLKKVELTTIAVRQVYDIYKANDTDNEINAIYSFMINSVLNVF